MQGQRSVAPVAWGVLLALSLTKLSLHVVSNARLAYGYMSDELYYLDCAKHLAWGYVDHPPLSVAVLWLVQSTLGDSLVTLRLVPALAGCATVVLVALMARELGGGRTAQALAGLAALVSPMYLATSGFYSMNAFEPALWAAAAYLVLRLVRRDARRDWLLLGIVLGLGLLNKVSMLWFGVGLGVGLLLTSERRRLRTAGPWLAVLIAAAVFAPHVLWQVQHGWPLIEFMRNAARTKLVAVPPIAFLGQQLLIMNPLVVPFWVVGLMFYAISEEGRRYRILGWVWVTVFLMLMSSGTARSYYIGPAYVVLLPAGGVAFERLAYLRGWRWLPATTAVTFAVGGAALLPFCIDILPPQRLVAYQQKLGLSAPRDEADATGSMPLHFALRFGWPEMVRAVADTYATLSPAEQKSAGILTETFGDAGAIDFFGPALGLPPAIGVHNSYWLWGPRGYGGDVMLVVARPDSGLLRAFAEAKPVRALTCEYCLPSFSKRSVYLCRRPHRPLPELWPGLKQYW